MPGKKILLPFFIFASILVQGQKLKKADKAIVQSLKSHIEYLASDKLEGRRAGTKGESLAAEYITKQFQQAGLQPKGDATGWLQAFNINDGKEVKSSSYFFINGAELKLNKEYFPLPFSANGNLEAMPAIALPESGMPWFVDLTDWIEDNQDNPHFDLMAKIQQYANDAANKGATALVLHNSAATTDQLAFDGKDKSPISKIPVIYLTREAGAKYLKDASASVETKIRIELGEKTRKGNNVVGYLNNGAVNTVIIGAHFDHLGHGEDGNSMIRNDVTQIHNGADDNASGAAVMLEAIEAFARSGLKTRRTILFAFWDGEERGMIGSRYWLSHPTLPIKRVKLNITLDMVGRLRDERLYLMGSRSGYGMRRLFNDPVDDSLAIEFSWDISANSDHWPFIEQRIPI
ncbi:MAG TPA: M20/M25/M40 family metallo-hydrolase, partial [Chitinophagaceae bacterium]|nr:M20/M25/M40 family metallo-hydrolase [Chitinophagaceae bacterium]